MPIGRMQLPRELKSNGGILDAWSNIGSAQASIPTRDDMIKAGIQKQMINEGTVKPMGRTYGNMSMGYGRPDWVADRNPGLREIQIGMAPQIKEAIYQDRIMNPNLPRFASQPQYRIRDQLKRDFQDVKQGLGSFKDKIGNIASGAYDTIGGGIKNILDNTIMGKIMAGFDATNPRAGNYNPALQSQIDFMKSQGMYGTNPTSGLNQITGGVLAGKNLQSMFEIGRAHV